MTGNQKADISTFPPDAAALYQRMHEDPVAALEENSASGNKEAMIWLLNNIPEFRPVGSCKATILGWTEGTGIWVLEGSEETHQAFDRVIEENPGIEQTEAVKKAGGTYYEHYKDYSPNLEKFAGEEETQESEQGN